MGRDSGIISTVHVSALVYLAAGFILIDVLLISIERCVLINNADWPLIEKRVLITGARYVNKRKNY